MANIGLYIELKDGVFKKSNRELLSLARKSGQSVHAVVFCADLQPYLDGAAGHPDRHPGHRAPTSPTSPTATPDPGRHHRRIQARRFLRHLFRPGQGPFPAPGRQGQGQPGQRLPGRRPGRPQSRQAGLLGQAAGRIPGRTTKGPCSPSGPMSSPWKIPGRRPRPEIKSVAMVSGDPLKTSIVAGAEKRRQKNRPDRSRDHRFRRPGHEKQGEFRHPGRPGRGA